VLRYIRSVADSSTRPAPALSPVRSALAVLAGFVALGVTNLLFMIVAGSVLASLYPSGEGAIPTDAGLALMLVAGVVNGTAAGLVTARIAGHAPFAHAAALTAVFGFYTIGSIDQVRGYPGWFVIGLVLAAPLGTMLGAFVASRRARA
jgi:hypothetical protein